MFRKETIPEYVSPSAYKKKRNSYIKDLEKKDLAKKKKVLLAEVETFSASTKIVLEHFNNLSKKGFPNSEIIEVSRPVPLIGSLLSVIGLVEIAGFDKNAYGAKPCIVRYVTRGYILPQGLIYQKHSGGLGGYAELNETYSYEAQQDVVLAQDGYVYTKVTRECIDSKNIDRSSIHVNERNCVSVLANYKTEIKNYQQSHNLVEPLEAIVRIAGN